MRKLTLELVPNEMMRQMMEPSFEFIRSYEVLETLKTEWEEGTRVDVIEFHFKENVSFDELEFIGTMEILKVLTSDDDTHTCLVKHHAPEDSKDFLKEFNLDLIFTTPWMVSPERHTYSVIGEHETVNKFAELIGAGIGKVENVTMKNAVYLRPDILSVLTKKQREVLITAHKFGYYDYPKRIGSDRLSERLNVSIPTLVQHLRKAEGRILAEIMDGYY
jgi:hypothetical protein